MLKEFFSTDVGLLSLVVIIVAIVVGGFTARFLIKNAAEDSEKQ